jgi:hypothetical protein
MSRFGEPPLTDELPEMIQRAAECDDPTVFRILDVIIEARKRAHAKRASEIVRMLDDGAA